MTKYTTFAEMMELIPNQKVSAIIRQIDKALSIRSDFEASKAKPAYIELEAAKKQMAGNKTLARFFAVMETNPIEFLNLERKAGYRTNLKIVRKVRMLAEYMRGEHGAINGVCKALFAATIIAAKQGSPWTSNNDAEKLLFQAFDAMRFSEEFFRSYETFSRLNIQSPEEARNQACQFRTAFENLGVYFNTRNDENDLSSNGIYADLTNPLIIDLTNRWGLNKAIK